jgi:ABC-2 type transport system permease protein
MWPLRISFSRLRPINAAAVLRVIIAAAALALFLAGDYILFRRLFKATAQIEEATPFFALGLLRNLLAMVFLVATIVLFSSALTAAIGAFFTDLDLDLYHAAPRSKTRIAVARWGKTFVQSAAVVFAFLAPLFIAFARQYRIGPAFYPVVFASLALLLTIPVSLASLLIVLLVRWFPVRRVHQIVSTIAILVFTVAVIAFRVSRPERFFTAINTDDVTRVLQAIELPSMDLYPGTAIADFMVKGGVGSGAGVIAIEAVLLFVAFVIAARAAYFEAFVRARESMAPAALGAAQVTRLLDRLLGKLPLQPRAMIAKEVRTIGRDVAQWSQVMLMGALLFIYLYNIRMLPLGGDARATVVAYANLGMAGFVVAAICLRFAYPSVSAEGKAFWIVQSAPIRYRQFLIVKVLVYAAPLTLLSVLLTIFANVILDADAVVWTFTLLGAVMLAVTLVSLGVGMGALAPQFGAENPLQVGLSLGGFAYMAVSMTYVGTIMLLMARPIVRYLFWRMFGGAGDSEWLSTAVPVVTAITASVVLMVFPILIAERRLARLGEQA